MAMVKKNLYLVPLIILIVTILYAVYTVSTTDIVFGNKHYLGILFIAISVISTIFKKDLGICIELYWK